MSTTVNTLIMLAPATVATVVTAVTEATPFEYGIVGIVLTIGLVPVMKWMMSRQDSMQQEANEIAQRREEREDRQIESHREVVVALNSLVIELRLLNDKHKDMSDKLNSFNCKFNE